MKKKFMVLLVVTLFITMMFSTGCKKKWDITGVWNWVLTYPTWSLTFSGTATFTGTKTAGTAVFNIDVWDPGTATYTVTGKDVIIVISWTNGNVSTLTGTSPSTNSISGTLTETYGATGTWTASR